MQTRRLTAMVIVAFVGFAFAGCASPGKTPRPAADAPLEHIEWCDVWVTGADTDELPRVLLVGDSITRGYFQEVERRLAGKANCARVTTSKCLADADLAAEIDLLLSRYRFKVVHVNNGLHGWAYSEEQYGRAFGPFMESLMKKSRGGRLIWVSTTPVVADGGFANERTERVKARNRIAAEFAAAHRIAIDDLFGLVMNHPELYSPDGVHFNKQGVEAQAAQVAACILKALDEK